MSLPLRGEGGGQFRERKYYGLRCRFRPRNRYQGKMQHLPAQTRPALHLITACGRSCLAAARVSSSSASGTAGLGSHREPIQYRAPASQPSRGSQSRNRAAWLTSGFYPNTETFSAVHNISVVWLPRLARSPGGLGGRSRIEPRLLISSLSAGVNRGSLRGGTP